MQRKGKIEISKDLPRAFIAFMSDKDPPKSGISSKVAPPEDEWNASSGAPTGATPRLGARVISCFLIFSLNSRSVCSSCG